MNIIAAMFGVMLIISVWLLINDRRKTAELAAKQEQRRANRRSTAWDGLHNYDVRPRTKRVVDTSRPFFDYQADQ